MNLIKIDLFLKKEKRNIALLKEKYMLKMSAILLAKLFFKTYEQFLMMTFFKDFT